MLMCVDFNKQYFYDFRPRHSAWKNNRNSLIFGGLHENWTLALRFQVSDVSSEKARASLKPMLREGFTTPDNVQKKDLFFNHVTRSGLG